MSKRFYLGALIVCATVGSGAYRSTIAGQNLPAAPSSADTYQQTVVPILAKNCFSCHSDRAHTANLSLEALRDPAAALAKPEVWTKVMDKLKSGTMPPRSMPAMAPEDVNAVTSWIASLGAVAPEAAHAAIAGSAAPFNKDAKDADPGRVTARRLNRAEYNHTIRDLLGVTLRPADEFPMDDSGYGFDNIGDVLSLSPMLMEKYVSAARAVSKTAVYGESYPQKPTRLVRFMTKKIQDDVPATGTVTPFSARGALYATYHAPVDAEYEIRFRYQNFRGGEQVTQADAPQRGAGAGRGRGAQAGTPADAPGGTPTGAPATAQGDNGPAPAPGVQPTPAQTSPAEGAAGTAAPQGGAAGAGGAQGGPGQAGAGRGGFGRGRAGGFVRRELTEEEKQARYEAARLAAPPEPLVLTVDGKQVYSYVVQGSTDYEYSRGESVVRVKLTAGDHALRASFPGLANMANPRTQFNPDGRRKLYLDYLDVMGPYAPSPERPASFKKIFICDPASGTGPTAKYSPDCAHKIIENLVTRAYRRPATEAEVQKLLGVVAQVQKADGFEEGVRVALQAILTSPNFLFRIERDPVSAPGDAKAGAKPGVAMALKPAAANGAATSSDSSYRINDFELASRLSYFLWSTMPDDALFEAARQNRLHDPAVLNEQVQRMLRDPKSSALAENFGEQWLNLRLMDRKKPDAGKFLLVDDELLEAMRKETLMFVDAVIHENRSILDFIDGKFTFVNGPLARYYGIPGVDGEQMQRVELDGEQRSGIVTQASILSISSYATRTSPVLRGKWVLDNLLGAAPPPPPDGIPPLVEKDLGTAASMRQRLEQHRADPSCAACHNAMDPIGFGLENYDAAGAWRVKDGNFDIDSSGKLPDGRTFVGAKGLKDILRSKSDAFTRNFTEKLMTFALGRGLESSDTPVVNEISAAVAHDNYRFATLVASIVNSRPFQMRTKAVANGGN